MMNQIKRSMESYPSSRNGWRKAAVAVAASMTLLLSACASTPTDKGDPSNTAAPELKTVRVAIAPTGTALPMVVADKQGLFKKYGLDATYEVSNVTISDQLATLGRQFDIAMGTQPALIMARAQGVPIVEITSGALDTKANPQVAIVASEKSGIKSLADLGGKTVGTLSLSGNIHYALMYAAKKQGVDLSTIKWVVGTVPQLPDQLKANRVDAIEEIEPFASIAIANGGVSLGDPFQAVGEVFGVWLSTSDWADKNEDTINRFTKAMAEASAWIADNQDEAREILGSYTGSKGEVLAKTPIPDFQFQTSGTELAAKQRPDLETWITILKETDGFSGSVKVDDLLPSWAK